MKFSARSVILALISTTMFFSGCSKKEEVETPESVRVVTPDKLEERNDMYYEINQATPFTGLVEDFYTDGQKKGEANFKDGKQYGVTTVWHANGQKKREENYKDGKLHGVTTIWHENGKKMEEWSFKEGKLHGVQPWWDENGQKMGEALFEDGVKKH